MLKDFRRIGLDLFLNRLNNSHSGNLSVRVGDRIVITSHGSMLSHLGTQHLIETGLYKDDKDDNNTALASWELEVHRAIYKGNNVKAIVHAHPIYATVLSLMKDELVPIDAEGQYLLQKIPVLSVEHTIGSQEVADRLPDLFKEHKVVMIRGHGSFAVGQSLGDAYQWTSSLENVCKIIYLTQILKGNTGETISFM